MAAKTYSDKVKAAHSISSTIRLGIAVLVLASSIAACSTPGYGGLSLDKGRSLYEQGKYEQAREHFMAFMAEKPDQRELAWQYLLKIRRAEEASRASAEVKLAKAPAKPPEFTCTGNRGGQSGDFGDKLISATFIEMDLREALLEISTQSGVSIVPDETVIGLVSASINNLPLEDALEMILAPNNFGFKRIKNFYLVGESSPENPSFHLLSETCLFKPAHLMPTEILDLIAPFYKPFINLQEKRGLLTVVAPRTMQRRIQQDVLSLDREPPQVLLELTIVEVTSKGRDMLGIDWSKGNSPTETGALLGNASLITGAAGSLGLSFTKVSSLTTKTFQATVNWLSEAGEATLRANPSIVTLDGHEAVFSSIHESWVDPTPGSLYKNKEKISYGVSMRIIPQISENNDVVLNIVSAEVSDLSINSMGNPEVISHSISNKVRVREGEALVLGGLLQTKKNHVVTKVPLLGDIPILGYFFKSEREEVRETEILIVIRPRVLSSGQVALREASSDAGALTSKE